jgi:hypothetical protein
MANQRLQGSRFERKYIITEEVSLQIRDFIGSRFELDEHCVGKANFSYPVHSLYLDSEDLKLHWSTINGDKERFKLRLRFYNDNPSAPVFLELKQRMKERSNKALVSRESKQGTRCIKTRAAVRRDVVDSLLAGDTPAHLAANDPGDLAALVQFCERAYELDVHPVVHVAYFREAFVSDDDNSARLTMDRRVRAEPQLAMRFSTQMQDPAVIWGQDIVLELKSTKEFPNLFNELIRIFGLRQCGAAKYVDSVATIGEDKLRPPS